MAPVVGDMATSAPSTSGTCVSDQPLPTCTARTTAPRRICFCGPALSLRPEATGFRPSPVTVMVSPDCSTATTLRGEASSTTAAFRSSLSGWSARASAIWVSSSAGLVGSTT